MSERKHRLLALREAANQAVREFEEAQKRQVDLDRERAEREAIEREAAEREQRRRFTESEQKRTLPSRMATLRQYWQGVIGAVDAVKSATLAGDTGRLQVEIANLRTALDSFKIYAIMHGDAGKCLDGGPDIVCPPPQT